MKFSHIVLAALAVFAPIQGVLTTVLLLIIFDLVLGVLAARKRGEKITSAGFRRTIAKLFIYEGLIGLAFLCEKYLIGSSIPAVKVLTSAVGLSELKSIVENADELNGSPIFEKLITLLGSQNQKNSGESEK